MAYIELNGLAVPVPADTGNRQIKNIGKRARGSDGTLGTSRRARKDSWNGGTTPQLQADAVALDGIVAGLGHSWPFDHQDAALLTPDLFDSKGAAPSGVGSSFFGKGADGADVVDVNGVAESKYGTGSLGCEAATTNILAANKRDVEDGTTGFAVVAGASMSVNTQHVLQGLQSLAIVTAAANDGATTITETVLPTTAYSASVYVKTATARNVRIRIDDNDATNTPADYLTVANKWMRLTVTHTTGGTASLANMRVLDLDAGGTTIYADAWQLEAGSAATAWADPTRDAGDLSYSEALINQKQVDLTINLWVRDTTATSASGRVMFSAYEHLTLGITAISIRRNATNGYPSLITTSDSVGTTTDFASSFDGAWHMLTVTIRNNPGAGEARFELFFDGVSEATENSAAVPDLTKILFLDVGNLGGLSNWHFDGEGRLDALMLLPYAATQAQITAWFNMADTPAILPKMRLTGDIVQGQEKLVQGTITDVRKMGGYVAGAYKTNLSKTQFLLEEK